MEEVDSMRDLGVIFDAKMTFGNQIEIVVNKCLRTLGFIKNVSRDFNSASTQCDSPKQKQLKNDYILAFKISHSLINSSEVNELFTERNSTYYLRNPHPLQSFDLTLDYIDFSTSYSLRHL